MAIQTSKPFRGLRRSQLRHGVTILEVLFATGIAVTGMLGVASLLLMAGRQASQANRSLETQTLADDWYNEFATRGMNRAENWIWFQDYTFNTQSGLAITPGTKRFSKQQFSNSDFAAGRLTHSTGSKPPLHFRPLGKTSVCLDPSFYAGRFVRQASTLGGLSQGSTSLWYRPAVFPYYQDGFNPLSDSAYRIGTISGQAWSDQPRMLRASLGVPGQIMTEKHMQTMFNSQGELTTLVSEEDKTIPAVRGFLSMPSPADPLVPIVAKGSNKTQYTWMATMSPLEAPNSISENYYTLSLIVMYQRDRLFVNPASFVERSSPNPDPVNNPQGERMTWVVPLSGAFQGGSGGRVRLIASQGTDDSVGVGDWIMLSKHVAGTLSSIGSTPVIEPYSVFRWFRIIAADAEALVQPLDAQLAGTGTTAPYAGADPGEAVWARDVVLDGPDWNFSPMMTGVSLPAPTTGTLIKGAIAVHERVIEVPNAGDF